MMGQPWRSPKAARSLTFSHTAKAGQATPSSAIFSRIRALSCA